MTARLLVVCVLTGCGFRVAAAVGDASDGAPGGGDAADGPTDGPPPDASPCRAVEVSAMSAHTCARMENGDVWCWGINGRGEIGRPAQGTCNGTVPCNPTPEKIAMPPATRLGVAEEHTCAIAGAAVYCWGGDTEGQFGDGAGADVQAPTLVTQRAGASAIGGGLIHGCSLHGGVVKCSGQNLDGEVGDGTLTPRPTPVVTVPSGAQVIANGYTHACAIEGGFVYCWGSNSGGQIDSSPSADVTAPAIVTGVATAAAITAGYQHTCIARAAGDLRCWGSNGNGQLGVGDTAVHIGEITTPLVTGIVEVSSGANHTCARTPLGAVYCWGEQYDGAAGGRPAPARRLDRVGQLPRLLRADRRLGVVRRLERLRTARARHPRQRDHGHGVAGQPVPVIAC